MLYRDLHLKQPIYSTTATYGHFGRPEFTWEQPKVLHFWPMPCNLRACQQCFCFRTVTNVSLSRWCEHWLFILQRPILSVIRWLLIFCSFISRLPGQGSTDCCHCRGYTLCLQEWLFVPNIAVLGSICTKRVWSFARTHTICCEPKNHTEMFFVISSTKPGQFS